MLNTNAHQERWAFFVTPDRGATYGRTRFDGSSRPPKPVIDLDTKPSDPLKSRKKQSYCLQLTDFKAYSLFHRVFPLGTGSTVPRTRKSLDVCWVLGRKEA